MLGRLFLLFTIVTLLEMYILVKLAMWMTFSGTLLLVIATGVLGAWLARREGRGVLVRIREQLARGEMPADALIDGLCVVIAGAFLMTPGVLTDAAGFALLVPAAREGMRRAVRTRFSRFMAEGGASFVTIDVGGASTGGFSGVDPAGPFGAGMFGAGRGRGEASGPEAQPVRPARIFHDGDVIDVTDD